MIRATASSASASVSGGGSSIARSAAIVLDGSGPRACVRRIDGGTAGCESVGVGADMAGQARVTVRTVRALVSAAARFGYMGRPTPYGRVGPAGSRARDVGGMARALRAGETRTETAAR